MPTYPVPARHFRYAAEEQPRDRRGRVLSPRPQGEPLGPDRRSCRQTGALGAADDDAQRFAGARVWRDAPGGE